jgi:hypothetical protein
MSTSKNQSVDSKMTANERTDLTRLVRDRGKVAKAKVEVEAARLRPDFEAQLARIFSWEDDEVWAKAKAAMDEATAKANREIDARCAELGIPRAFRPGEVHGWLGRRENSTAERRAELRQVATSAIKALAAEANQAIDIGVLEASTALLVDGLTSEDARRWLDSLPTVEALMPASLDPKALRSITVSGGWGTKHQIAALSEAEVDMRPKAD